jgi:PKD repeat protein
VVADTLPEGLSGYRLTVSIADTSVATISGGSYPGTLGTTQTPEVADDGSSIELKAADTGTNVQPGASDATLGAVTFDAVTAGETAVTISVAAIDDESGDALSPTTTAGTLSVLSLPTFEGGATPTDPDGDGQFEDLNGNGELDYDDVVLLFNNTESEAVTDNVDAFDFNDNGRIDFDDVVDLNQGVSDD